MYQIMYYVIVSKY